MQCSGIMTAIICLAGKRDFGVTIWSGHVGVILYLTFRLLLWLITVDLQACYYSVERYNPIGQLYSTRRGV